MVIPTMDVPRVVTLLCVFVLSFFVYEAYRTLQYSMDAVYENELRNSGIFLWERTGSRSRFIHHTSGESNVAHISESLLELSRKSSGSVNKAFLKQYDTQSMMNRNITKLNVFELTLLEKEKRREAYLEQFIKEQTETDDNNNYVVFYPLRAGLGNSLAAMIEALLVSMVTHRHFRIYNYPIFNNYFSLPFDNYFINDESFLEEENMVVDNTCAHLPSDILSSPKRYVIIRSTCHLLDFILSNEKYYDFLNSHGFILNNQRFSIDEVRKLMKYFLYTKVILTKQFVLDEVEKVKRQLNWTNYFVIGLQIRTGRLKRDDVPSFFIRRDDISYFVLKAKEVTQQMESKQRKPVRWFVACDNLSDKEMIRAGNPRQVFVTGCPIVHSFVDMYNEAQTSSMLCTLIDNYLLSSTQYAILTAKSTYGLLAMARTMDLPKIQVRQGAWKQYIQKHH